MIVSNAIRLEGVTKRFGSHTAVDRLSLDVPGGTIYGFLGPNGAGKTTTLRMVTGILTPVIDMVSYFGQLKGLKRSEARQRAEARLRAGGLGDWISSKCNELSKGMGQKVQVIATLLHDPDLVVLDEPFSGLDPVNAELVLDLIKRYKREGRSVIFSTHVVEHAEQICDSVVIIDHGQRKVAGTLSEVKATAERTVLLDYEGDPGNLSELPGVVAADDSGQHAELKLSAEADAQKLLEMLVARVRIRRFDTREASLKQIFMNAVEEVRHEAA